MALYLREVTTLQLDRQLCVGCGLCQTVCPQAVFSLAEGKATIGDRDACMECGACARNCPVGAIDVEMGVGCATAVLNEALGRKTGGCC
ncbi:MAG: mercury methylation ferredoxin HgcB [Thermodesulfobacteriota bacterium]